MAVRVVVEVATMMLEMVEYSVATMVVEQSSSSTLVVVVIVEVEVSVT